MVELPTVEDCLAAREVISRYLPITPVTTVDINGTAVIAKLESLQVTGSFKVRGGMAALAAVQREDASRAVITASAGNHGLGVAYASQLLGVKATVVVPRTASPAKVAKLQQFPIELIQHGDNFDEAQEFTKELGQQRGMTFVSAFNNTHVIAGQSTVMDEFLTQSPSLTHVVVPVGGGGLISGALLSRKRHDRGDLSVTGVQPEVSAAMYHVMRGVPMAEVHHEPTIADGLAGGGDADSVTNELIRAHAVELVLVPEATIRAAVPDALLRSGLLLEGSSAAAWGALATGLIPLTGGTVGFIASGRNIAAELLSTLLSDYRDNLRP